MEDGDWTSEDALFLFCLGGASFVSADSEDAVSVGVIAAARRLRSVDTTPLPAVAPLAAVSFIVLGAAAPDLFDTAAVAGFRVAVFDCAAGTDELLGRSASAQPGFLCRG